jgi:hypothetical protein
MSAGEGYNVAEASGSYSYLVADPSQFNGYETVSGAVADYDDLHIIADSGSVNNPPIIKLESPSDGAVDVSIYLSQLTVDIEDPEGDLFDWAITVDPEYGSASGIADSDGTKICFSEIKCCMQPGTTYTWTVTATDQGSKKTTTNIYTFTTEEPDDIDVPPDEPCNPYPYDGQDYLETTVELGVDVSDENGDLMDVFFYDGDGNQIGIVKDISSGERAELVWSDLKYDTTYEWYVIAEDESGLTTTSPIWMFSTEDADVLDDNDPEKPSDTTQEIIIGKPLENHLYLNNEEICSFGKTFIIGAIDIEASVTLSDVDKIKFFIEDEQVAEFDYDPLKSVYSYHWEDKALFWKTIKVGAYNGEQEINSAELDVLAFIF